MRVRCIKDICKIFMRVRPKQMIFNHTHLMITPRIEHLGQVAVIQSHPAIKNAGHHFYQQQDNQLGIAEANAVKKPDFGNQPGKEDEITNKQKIVQQRFFYRCKIHKDFWLRVKGVKGVKDMECVNPISSFFSFKLLAL